MKEGEKVLRSKDGNFASDAVLFVEKYLQTPHHMRESNSPLDPYSISHDAEIFFLTSKPLLESKLQREREIEQERLIKNLFAGYEYFFNEGLLELTGHEFRRYANDWLDDIYNTLFCVDTERTHDMKEVIMDIDLLKINEYAQNQLANIEDAFLRVPNQHVTDAYNDNNKWKILARVANEAYLEELGEEQQSM